MTCLALCSSKLFCNALENTDEIYRQEKASKNCVPGSVHSVPVKLSLRTKLFKTKLPYISVCKTNLPQGLSGKKYI